MVKRPGRSRRWRIAPTLAAALRPDRRHGRRAHGAVGARHCLVGRARGRRRPAARDLLGGAPRPIRGLQLAAGLGLMAPQAAGRRGRGAARGGFEAVKLRLGYATLGGGPRRMRAVRKRLPERVLVMVDYNQALTAAEALRRGRALQSEGVAWLEEPIRHDDYRGNARDRARSLDAAAADRRELQRSRRPWQQALAARRLRLRHAGPRPHRRRHRLDAGRRDRRRARRRRCRSHLLPEVSAHLLAATPTCHWLEYVDWADAILEEPLRSSMALLCRPIDPASASRGAKRSCGASKHFEAALPSWAIGELEEAASRGSPRFRHAAWFSPSRCRSSAALARDRQRRKIFTGARYL